jgi:hypothetical protein
MTWEEIITQDKTRTDKKRQTGEGEDEKGGKAKQKQHPTYYLIPHTHTLRISDVSLCVV